jgi:hypothetical protein
MPQAGGFEPPPLGVHRVGRSGGGDQVGGLIAGAADPTPQPDVSLGRGRPDVLDPRALRLVPASRKCKSPRGQPGVQPDLAEPLRERFARLAHA